MVAGLFPLFAQRGGHAVEVAGPGGQALFVARGQFGLQRGGGPGCLGGRLHQALDLGQRATGVYLRFGGNRLRGLRQRFADFLLAGGGLRAGLLPFLAQRRGHRAEGFGPGGEALFVARAQFGLQR
ncbi:hypothetical protein D9M68_812300 [compost metagenome]